MKKTRVNLPPGEIVVTSSKKTFFNTDQSLFNVFYSSGESSYGVTLTPVNTDENKRLQLMLNMNEVPGAVWQQISNDVTGFFFLQGRAPSPPPHRDLGHDPWAEAVTRRQVSGLTGFRAGAPRWPVRDVTVFGHHTGLVGEGGVVLDTQTVGVKKTTTTTFISWKNKNKTLQNKNLKHLAWILTGVDDLWGLKRDVKDSRAEGNLFMETLVYALLHRRKLKQD